MSDICIRPAQPSDRSQLLRFREALWPKVPVEEHARELGQILEGEAPVMLPLIILVAEAHDRTLAGFLEVDLRSHADGAIHPGRSATSRVGTSPRIIVTGASGDNCWLRQKIGHAAGVASRWRRTRGSTTKCRNECTRRWDTRSWTAVCITVRRCKTLPRCAVLSGIAYPTFIEQTRCFSNPLGIHLNCDVTSSDQSSAVASNLSPAVLPES